MAKETPSKPCKETARQTLHQFPFDLKAGRQMVRWGWRGAAYTGPMHTPKPLVKSELVAMQTRFVEVWKTAQAIRPVCLCALEILDQLPSQSSLELGECLNHLARVAFVWELSELASALTQCKLILLRGENVQELGLLLEVAASAPTGASLVGVLKPLAVRQDRFKLARAREIGRLLCLELTPELAFRGWNQLLMAPGDDAKEWGPLESKRDAAVRQSFRGAELLQALLPSRLNQFAFSIAQLGHAPHLTRKAGVGPAMDLRLPYAPRVSAGPSAPASRSPEARMRKAWPGSSPNF